MRVHHELVAKLLGEKSVLDRVHLTVISDILCFGGILQCSKKEASGLVIIDWYLRLLMMVLRSKRPLVMQEQGASWTQLLRHEGLSEGVD